MSMELKLPDPGEGIHEAEIVEVLVSEGDTVEEDQAVLTIETDKATTEVPSPVDGTVKEIRVKAGDTVEVGDVLMVFDTDETEEKEAASEEEGKPEKKEEAAGEKESEAEEKPSAEKEKKKAGPAEKPTKGEAEPKRDGPVPATPSTRRLARELGVDLHEVPPTGPEGRVTAEDVRAFAEGKEPEKEKAAEPSEEKAAPEEKREPEKAPAPPESPELPDFTQWGPVERMPLRSIRKATARQMARAWREIPHVSHQDQADITDLEAFRKKHREEIEDQGGALTITVFAMKAAVAALKAQPRFNASLDMAAGEIILKRHYHIGVAVDTERGLIVPVIRDVDRKNIVELSQELKETAERVRNGEIDREDVTGGTFTITNIGSLGGTAFTPIINHPQTAILGLAQARTQPVFREGLEKQEVVPRLILPMLVAFDHRVADGADAARFLNVILQAFEDPERLMMVM